jgi:hypothetical protein
VTTFVDIISIQQLVLYLEPIRKIGEIEKRDVTC